MIVINQQSIKSKPIIQIKRIIVQTRGVSNYNYFKAVLKIYTHDKASQIYLERCQQVGIALRYLTVNSYLP